MEHKHHADDHYRAVSPQPIDVIDNLMLGYKAGNVIKYIARAEFKGQRIDDYKKCLEYLKMLDKEYKEYKDLMERFDCWMFWQENHRQNKLTRLQSSWSHIPAELFVVIEAILLPSQAKLNEAITVLTQWVSKLE